MPSVVEKRGGNFGRGVYRGIERMAQFVQVVVPMPVIRTDVRGGHRLKGTVDPFDRICVRMIWWGGHVSYPILMQSFSQITIIEALSIVADKYIRGLPSEEYQLFKRSCYVISLRGPDGFHSTHLVKRS